MDCDREALDSDRNTLHEALGDLCAGVALRAAADFHPLDSSVAYASNGARAFVVTVIEDVTWGPEPSSYVTNYEEFGWIPTMMVDLPNALEGQLGAVQSLFRKWFTNLASRSSA
jgi:hypothetical protein